MPQPAGRTGSGAPPGQGRAVSRALVAALVVCGLMDVTAAADEPKILQPVNGAVITEEDKSLEIVCSAETKWEKLHSIYWLVNNTFVEDAYPDGRVTEQREGAVDRVVKKMLRFRPLQPEDFWQRFTCVVVDPSGRDYKHFQLQPEISGIRITEITDGQEGDPWGRE